MNLEPQYPPLENQAPAPDSPAGKPKAATPYRPKGKIAALPKEQRQLVNSLLLDGKTYVEICQKMAELGVSLNAENVSNWHNGPGYQDWLFHQQWCENTRSLQESALDLMEGGSEPARFNQAALQLATLQIFAALRHLPRGALDEKLGGDSASFSRLVNALSRATRETLNSQKYIDARARAREALAPMKDPKRKLTEEERRAIVLHVDEILGLNLVDPRWAAGMREKSAATGIIRLEGVERLGGSKSEGRSPKCREEAHESDELHELEGNGSEGGGDHGLHRTRGNGAAAEEPPIEPEPLDPNAPVF